MGPKAHYESYRDVHCWLGFGLGIIGNLTRIFSPGLGGLLVFAALILNVFGCYYWAKSKRRSPAFCLWGLVAPIGFLGTALLADKWKSLT